MKESLRGFLVSNFCCFTLLKQPEGPQGWGTTFSLILGFVQDNQLGWLQVPAVASARETLLLATVINQAAQPKERVFLMTFQTKVVCCLKVSLEVTFLQLPITWTKQHPQSLDWKWLCLYSWMESITCSNCCLQMLPLWFYSLVIRQNFLFFIFAAVQFEQCPLQYLFVVFVYSEGFYVCKGRVLLVGGFR